ncbi:MAG TPA: hypothetical protein VH143_21725 [Kofleriaceae bacterium]|nr:hypothetical protein [Kofleriaceae bacterium]
MTFARDKRFAGDRERGDDLQPGKLTRVSPARSLEPPARVPGRRTLVEQEPAGYDGAHAIGAKVDAFVHHSTQLRTAHEHHVDAAVASAERAVDPHAHPHAHAGATHEHARVAADPHRIAYEARFVAPPHRAQHGPVANAKGPIELKKISDWQKFVPQLPNGDARERGRILKLVQSRINAQRQQASHVLGHMRDEQLQIAAQIHAREPELDAEIERARAKALGEVAASEAAKAASIQVHAAGVIAHVRASAAAMKAQVTSTHARTVAEIHRSLQQATQQLAREHQQAIQKSHTDEATQVTVVAAKFTATKARLTALGGEKASQASGLGDSTPLPYQGKKLTAARKAARQVAAQYASAMPAQASKAAAQLCSHQADVDKAVHTIANEVRQHIDSTFHRSTKLLQTAHRQTLALADRTKTGALHQIEQTAATSVAQIGSSSASQVASVRSQGAGARTQIAQTAVSSVASIKQACASAVKEFDDGAHKIAQAAHEVEVPNAAKLELEGGKAIADLHGKQHAVLAGLQQQAAKSSRGVASLGSSAVQGMAQAATQANATTTQLGAGAGQQIAQAAQQSDQALREIGQSFEKQSAQIAKTTEQSFHKLDTGEATEYKHQATKLQSGLDSAYNSIRHSFDQAVPHKEVADILKQAAAAAAKVKSGWSAFFSDVLKVVEIVVIVVVAVAIVALVSVLTDGLGDVLLGEGMAWMIDGLADAVAGGLSNMAQTILQNVLLDHKGWSSGMYTALWQGAAAGAASAVFAKGGELLVASKLGGKIGLGGVADALEGGKGWSNIWRRGAFDLTAGTIGATFQQLVIEGEAWNGQWSSREFWINLATNAATVGATSHGKFDELTEGVQTKLYGKKLEAGDHAGHAAPAKDPSYQPEHAKPETTGASGSSSEEVAKGLADAGYPNAQKANADRAASAVESGTTPAAGDVRETAANARGVAELHAVLSDPSLTALEKVRIGARLAQSLRSKAPTGTLDADVHAAAHGRS